LCSAVLELARVHTVTEVGYLITPLPRFKILTASVQQFMSAIGRKCSVVNLDPANDSTTYECAIDVRSLIKLEEIMEEDDLGPNGAVLYALEELEQNMEWLEKGLSALGEDYVLFDCPGQVELYTHHSSLRNIFFRLQNLGYRVCEFSLHRGDVSC
jgi:GTPase SAR1 family protein